MTSPSPTRVENDGTYGDEVKQPDPTTSQDVPQLKGTDAALNLLKDTGGIRQPLDAEASKRLVRKVDLHIMPLICIVYFLQYIDKTAISYASVTGILESTHLHGNQFNWVASIFFFGYVTIATRASSVLLFNHID